MSDTTLRLARPTTFLGRVLAFIDQQLLAYAEAAIRNGDVLRCDTYCLRPRGFVAASLNCKVEKSASNGPDFGAIFLFRPGIEQDEPACRSSPPITCAAAKTCGNFDLADWNIIYQNSKRQRYHLEDQS